jgi:biopolymer transport protein ExbD
VEVPEYWGAPGSPAVQGARAQLVLALLAGAIFPMLLLGIPIQTHSVKLDLPALRPESYSGPGGAPRRRVHSLVVTPRNEALFDGLNVNLAELRSSLDLVEASGEWVDFSPEPNARYEMFVETLAVTRRARLERLRLDNRPFRRSFDPPPPGPVRRSARLRLRSGQGRD